MLDGIYRNPTTIFFGRDYALHLGSEVQKHADRVMLLYGGGSIKHNGVYAYVTEALHTAGIAYTELPGVAANPRADLIRRGIAVCRKEKISFILAVGGGSVVDTAKAIALGVHHEGDIYGLFDGSTVLPSSALEIGVVLTLSGTGSESSPDTVVNFGEFGEKLALSSPLLYPRFAFLNPEHTFSLSQGQTMAGIVDAICHVLERYFTHTPAVDCTDRIGEGLLRSLINCALLLLDEPLNYNYRSEAMWACKLAHDNTAGFGRKHDWATHRIAHEVAAIYDTVHGVTLSALFPAWMDHCQPQQPARFSQLAERVFGLSGDDVDIRLSAQFRIFFYSVGVPVTLREAGVPERVQFDRIAANAVKRQKSGTIGNFVRLTPGDIVNILESAY